MVQDKQQWKELKKNHKVFIVSVSDSLCLSCCQDEPLLAKFIKDRPTLKYKGKEIPVVRVDAAQKQDFIEEEGLSFSELPLTLIYFQGEFYVNKESTV